MNSLPSSSALQTHSPHTHTFTLIPVIPEMSRVDWTRLMGDICPGWISIWVRNLWNKVSGLHAHINTPVPNKQGRRGFEFPPNQQTAQSGPSRHTDTVASFDYRAGGGWVVMSCDAVWLCQIVLWGPPGRHGAEWQGDISRVTACEFLVNRQQLSLRTGWVVSTPLPG